MFGMSTDFGSASEPFQGLVVIVCQVDQEAKSLVALPILALASQRSRSSSGGAQELIL